MIVVDANLLIYAVNKDAPRHRMARAWLELTLSGPETVGLSWVVLLAFLRLTTRAGVFQKPITAVAALDIVQGWISQPSVVILEPGREHLRMLRELIQGAGTAGNLTSDAHLAAIAIEHGAELCTTDSDFSRFTRLRWRNPLK